MFSGNILRDAIISGSNNIYNQRQRVDDLNVFPVPDGDTGTNMSMTVGNAARELSKYSGETAEKISAVAASALLMGARGNSGVITSLLFRGFSQGFKDAETITAENLVVALEKGVAAAYKAVLNPKIRLPSTFLRLKVRCVIIAAKYFDKFDTIHITTATIKVLGPANTALKSISIPTPIRKNGMKIALPTNSNLFINGEIRGIKELIAIPTKKAPIIASSPAS